MGFLLALPTLFDTFVRHPLINSRLMSSTQDQNKVNIAIDWVKKLANGINPIDGSVLSDSDIVNNVHISRCLFYVAELIAEAGKRKASPSKQYDVEFFLTPEDLSRIYITEKSSISVFVKEINRVIPDNMKPLSYTSVTNWLVKTGYLVEILKEDGHKTKTPTEQGRSIGISSEQRVGSNGEYTAVLYNSNAQRYILDNLINGKI